MDILFLAAANTAENVSGFLDEVANLLPFPWNLVVGAIAGVVSFFGAKKLSKKKDETPDDSVIYPEK